LVAALALMGLWRWRVSSSGWEGEGYANAGISHGWLPNDPGELVGQGQGAGGGDVQLVWQTDYPRPPGAEDIDLGPGREAWIAVWRDEDATTFEIGESVGDGSVLLLSRWSNVSGSDALRGARELSWDPERAWEGDTPLGADIVATYLPAGVDRVRVIEAVEGVVDHAVEISNADGSQFVRVTRFPLDADRKGNGVGRQFPMGMGSAWVTVETSGLPDEVDAAVLDGLRVGCCWQFAGPDLFRTVVETGSVHGVPTALMIGEDNPNWVTGLGPECMIVQVGDDDRSMCTTSDIVSGPWMLEVGGEVAVLQRSDRGPDDRDFVGGDPLAARIGVRGGATAWDLTVTGDAPTVDIPPLDVLHRVEAAHPGVGAIRWADDGHESVVIAPVRSGYPERTIALADLP